MYGKVIFMALLSLGLLACNNTSTEAKKTSTAVQLKSQQDKVSYSIGHNIGNNLKQQKIDVTDDALVQGLRDGISGGKLLMTEDEMKTTMQQFQTEQMAKMKKQQEEAADKNRQVGEKFLAENGKKRESLPSTVVCSTVSRRQARVRSLRRPIPWLSIIRAI